MVAGRQHPPCAMRTHGKSAWTPGTIDLSTARARHGAAEFEGQRPQRAHEVIALLGLRLVLWLARGPSEDLWAAATSQQSSSSSAIN